MVETRTISLTQGKVAIVDAEDYDLLMQWKWHLSGRYAVRMAERNKGKQSHIMMHRFIMGIGKEDPRVIDHMNREALDNRKTNLRICNHAENMRNIALKSCNSSGYRGVSWKKGIRKWQSAIRVDNKGCYCI
jgi:hypothetical protein